MYQIKQSEATAARRRVPILFVSSTDGFTPVTPTSPAAYISVNGGTFAATTNTVTLQTLAAGQSAAGCYYVELTAAEVGTLGIINLNVQSTNARQYNAIIQVMAYDYAAVTNLGLTAIPAVATGSAGAIPTTGTGANQIQVNGAGAISTVVSVSGSVGSVTGNVGGSVASVVGNVGGNLVGSVGSLTATAVQNVWDDTTSSLTTVGSVGKLIVDNLNATVSSRATDAGVWTNATRTLTAGTNIVLAKGTGITGFNDITATDVWAATTRTLSAGTNIVLAKGTGITGFNDITSQSVWDVLTANVTAVNSIGVQLKTNIDVATSTRLASASYTTPPTAVSIATQVWSESLPGSYTATQAGFKLNAAGGAADPWSTVLPGSYPANTAGNIIGNRLDTNVGSRMATFTLPTNFSLLAISGTGGVTAGTVSDKTGYSLSAAQTFNTTGSVGSVTGSVASVTGNVGGNVVGSVNNVVGNVGGNVVGSVGSVSGSVGSVADASTIWNHLTTNILTTNSIGLLLKTNVDAQISSRLAGSSYTVPPTVTQIWQAILPGTFTLGQAGYILGTNLDATISSRLASSSYTAAPTTTQINQALWNQVRATASPTGGVPAVGTFGYFLDSRVSTAGGGGGGVIIKQGPFKLSATDLGPNNILDLVKGDNRNIQFSIIDEHDENLPLNGAYTYTVKVYDSASILVSTYAATLDYATGGLVSFNIDTTVTNNIGNYNAVLVENNGTSNTIYGGLEIQVRL